MAKKLSAPSTPRKNGKAKKSAKATSYWQSLTESLGAEDEEASLAPLIHGLRRDAIRRRIP
jgi:hypothetical protein